MKCIILNFNKNEKGKKKKQFLKKSTFNKKERNYYIEKVILLSSNQ
jgi:hypothetical protein